MARWRRRGSAARWVRWVGDGSGNGGETGGVERWRGGWARHWQRGRRLLLLESGEDGRDDEIGELTCACGSASADGGVGGRRRGSEGQRERERERERGVIGEDGWDRRGGSADQ